MKILYVISSLEGGGAESQLCSFALEWRKKYPEIPIHICTLKQGGKFENRLRDRGIPITILYSSSFIRSVILVRKLILKESFSIIHAHMLLSDIVCRFATIGTHAKLVVTHHGLGKWKKKWLLLIDKITKKHVDRFIMVSKQSYDIRSMREKYPTEQMIVVHNGISELFLNEDSRRLPPLNENIIIGSIARMTDNKQLNLMVDVMNELKTTFPRLYYEIIGEGENFEKLREQVKLLNIEDRVKFWGWIDNEKVKQITDRWSIFALPSINEDLPVSMLECMAQGIVPIASSVGGIIALLDNNKNGILCDSGDRNTFVKAISQLVTSPEMYSKMSDNSRQLVKQNFLIGTVVDKYMAVYRGLDKKQ